MSCDSLGHLADALKKQWKRYRKELKRCQERFSEKAVHGSRVETRRLLATVDLLGGFLPAGRVKKVERALKRHLDTFDELRDIQVQLQLVGRMERAYPAARKFLAYLVNREDRFARRTRKQIKKVKTRRLARLIQECRETVERQRTACTLEQANAILWRTVNRAFARAEYLRKRIDSHDAETIHHTRVAFKKFRYMVESWAACLPFANESRLEAMRHYQTLMGDIQDVEVLLASFAKFLGKQEVEPNSALRFSQELLDRRHRLVQIYLTVAGRLREFWPT